MKKIQLTQGQCALVDNEDYEKLCNFSWHASKRRDNFYAGRMTKKQDGEWATIYMAREILGVTDKNVFVDHINGNTLDNRKENLRKSTRAQNSRNRGVSKTNRSGYKGVVKLGKYWRVSITNGDERHFLGSFNTSEEAARHYNKAAIEMHGEFARLNNVEPIFPTEGRALLKKNNQSGYSGVCWCSRTKKWLASARLNGNRKYIGYFETPEAAFSAINFTMQKLK